MAATVQFTEVGKRKARIQLKSRVVGDIKVVCGNGQVCYQKPGGERLEERDWRRGPGGASLVERAGRRHLGGGDHRSDEPGQQRMRQNLPLACRGAATHLG